LTFELDLDSAKMNQHAKYPGGTRAIKVIGNKLNILMANKNNKSLYEIHEYQRNP